MLQPGDQRKARRLSRRLLTWYGDHARNLPWRHTQDPYAIWISEIMLQQTQVTTVIAYWKRWMKALPTVQQLASAPPERVLKLWEGLGYYSRARNLQAAAKQIVSHHHGEFPHEPEAIRALPGIGRYTAGAIGSIAFNRPEPIVDGNVIRILTRLFGLREDPKGKTMQSTLWGLAEMMVRSVNDYSSLNQSLMELGATVCHPRSPQCVDCPVYRSCVARRTQLVDVIPAKPARAKSERRNIEVYIFTRPGRILLQQRPDGFHNAGFWELPNNETGPAIPLPSNAPPMATERHTITKFRIQLTAFAVTRKPGSGTWFTTEALSTIPITAAHRKLLKKLRLG